MFGVDSSSHFPVKARTNRHTDTDATERNTQYAGGYAAVGNDFGLKLVIMAICASGEKLLQDATGIRRGRVTCCRHF